MTKTRLFATATCLAALALPVMPNSACTGFHVCTLVACEDEATVDLQSPTGRWAPGNYELALVIDGNATSCALLVPGTPSPTSPTEGSCTSKVSLTLLAEMQCGSLHSDGSAVDQSSAASGHELETCTPVPGHFYQTLTLPGTPAHVSLTLSRDGHSLASKTLALTYLTSQPNGPECAPTCYHASVSLTIGDDTTDVGSADGPTADAGVE